MRKILSLLLIIVSSLAVAQKRAAIKCGKILDVYTGKWLTGKVILVNDNKIDAIIDKTSFNIKVDSLIDLSSYYVLPGLIDCHTHVLLQGDITSEDYDVQF